MKTKTIIEWEIGDTVEVINDNHAPQLEAGAKGVVFHLDRGGNPLVRQTSPNPYGNGKWCINATDLRPWKPGYGYLPNGEAVPEPPEGFELVPEDSILSVDGGVGVCWGDGTVVVGSQNEYNMDAIVDRLETGAIRAVYRRKQPALQVREGAYYRRRDGVVVGPAASLTETDRWLVGNIIYECDGLMWGCSQSNANLIAEVPAPEPKLVPFDGPEDLPEWPVIWVRYPDGRIRMSMDHDCDGLMGNYPVLWFAPWNSLFNGFQISPDRRNWQTAGKEVAG